jgi:hypothetical protein
VTTAPEQGAKLPDPVEPKPLEPPTEFNPVEQAAQSAIKQRLAEVEHAAEIQRAAPAPQPEPEPPRVVDGDPVEEAIRDWPERAKRWVRENPQLITDPEQAARLQYAHHIAARETGEQMTPRYFAAMESLLELPQAEPPPQPQPPPQRQAPPPPRPSGPSAGYYSAPPHREAPSMSTGRPQSGPTRLTSEELDLARTLKLSPDEYRAGKERMLREKAAGFRPDGQ